MAKQFRFILVSADGDVAGTDDLELALFCKRDGNTLVIEPAAREQTFEGEVEVIEDADREDWGWEDDDNEDDDEDEGEG